MGRPRTKTMKKFDLDDVFSLKLDTYKRKVVLFHFLFNIKREEKNGKLKTENIDEELMNLLKTTFGYVRGRKIFDIENGCKITGYMSHIEMSAYLEIFDGYEDSIKEKCREMIPQIKNLFDRYGFQCIKSKRYFKNERMENDTEL